MHTHLPLTLLFIHCLVAQSRSVQLELHVFGGRKEEKERDSLLITRCIHSAVLSNTPHQQQRQLLTEGHMIRSLLWGGGVKSPIIVVRVWFIFP